MKILELRSVFNSDCTISELFVNGTFFRYSLEPVDRGLYADMPLRYMKERKVYGKTAIPYGTYQVVWSYSPTFKRYTPEVLDVPCFSGIRMHKGNYPKDTKACLLIGDWKGGSELVASKKWSDKLDDLVKTAYENGEEVWLEVRGFCGSVLVVD